MFAAASHGVAAENALVAREDFKINETWLPPAIFGRDFWNFLPARLTKGKEINNEPMIQEAGVRYNLGITLSEGKNPTNYPQDSPDIVSVSRFKDKDLRKDVPFILQVQPHWWPCFRNFKVVCLVGGYDLSAPLNRRLMEYVRAGGTLLVNIKQISQHVPMSFLGVERTHEVCPISSGEDAISLIDTERIKLAENYEYEKIILKGARPVLVTVDNNVLASVACYGKGYVILAAVDHLIPKDNLDAIPQKGKDLPFVSFLLKHFVKEVLPVAVEGDVEYGLNRIKDGWLIYLINNKGIYKCAREPQRLVPEEAATVRVDIKKIRADQIVELRNGKQLAPNPRDNGFSIVVEPGDVAVVKIRISQKPRLRDIFRRFKVFAFDRSSK